MNKVQLGSNIRRWRLERGMTLEDLALKAGYAHRSAIWRLEAGDCDVPLQRLEKIAAALNVSVSTLICGK